MSFTTDLASLLRRSMTEWPVGDGVGVLLASLGASWNAPNGTLGWKVPEANLVDARKLLPNEIEAFGYGGFGHETSFLAGLWASHNWEGERTESYTMVMQETVPGDDMHVFHSRQPVVLDRAGAATWLDLGADYRLLLKGPPVGTLAIDPPEPAAA